MHYFARVSKELWMCILPILLIFKAFVCKTIVLVFVS